MSLPARERAIDLDAGRRLIILIRWGMLVSILPAREAVQSDNGS